MTTLNEIRIEEISTALDAAAENPTASERPTPETIAKVLALDLPNFTRAIFEYLLDGPRTIEPHVGRLMIGDGVKVVDGKAVIVGQVLAAFSVTNPENPQVYGSVDNLGMILVDASFKGKLTLPEVMSCVGCFLERIEGFVESAGPSAEHMKEMDCDGECDTCTRHDKEISDILKQIENGSGN